MTGEITLEERFSHRWLERKTFSGKRAGIKRVVIPGKQETLSDFPADILAGMEITYVKKFKKL